MGVNLFTPELVKVPTLPAPVAPVTVTVTIVAAGSLNTMLVMVSWSDPPL